MEEFNFPRISDTCAHNIGSPPLWNLSPVTSPNPYYQGNKIGENENRMNMLWEDFNEELYSTKGEVVELRYAPTLTIAKTNNTSLLLTKNNKPGMVVIVKLMKKLLSINNSQGLRTMSFCDLTLSDQCLVLRGSQGSTTLHSTTALNRIIGYPMPHIEPHFIYNRWLS
ncbi:hypothetical protein GmHk_11G032898 [Glycine max]|nr:hypothetical protein GmHk_11G032898 [Glycine max]